MYKIFYPGFIEACACVWCVVPFVHVVLIASSLGFAMRYVSELPMSSTVRIVADVVVLIRCCLVSVSYVSDVSLVCVVFRMCVFVIVCDVFTYDVSYVFRCII